MNNSIKAVLWDFGGVITSSPFEAFNRLEAARGLPGDFIRGVNAVAPDSNAWARFERAEMDAAAFDAAFADEAACAGHDLRGADVLACLSGSVRPEMVAALDTVKAAGYRIACITNNVPAGKGAGMAATGARSDDYAAAFARFETIVESSTVGVRKPDPQIYLMACKALGVAPAQCVYLDDLGINCKAAAMLGMAAIKVTGGAQALRELSAILGLELPESVEFRSAVA